MFSIGVSLIVGLGIYWLVQVFWTQGRRITFDYNQLVKEEYKIIPIEDQAWPLYHEIFASLPRESWREISDPRIRSDTDAESVWETQKKALKQHADVIARLREAASRPCLGYMDDPHSDVIELMAAARAFNADARRAGEANDGETAAADWIASLRLSWQAESDARGMVLLIGQWNSQQVLDKIREQVLRHPDLFSNDSLMELAVECERLNPRASLAHYRDFWHRMRFRHTVQRLFTDDGNGEGVICWEGYEEFATGLFRDLDPSDFDSPIFGETFRKSTIVAKLNEDWASRKPTMDLAEPMFTAAARYVRLPAWEREAALAKLGPIDPADVPGTPRTILDLELRGVRETARSADAKEASRNATVALLALERYRRDHMKWPEALDELVPDYLDAVLIDPFDGKPLRYRHIDGKILLYSVGKDGEDDDGKPGNLGDDNDLVYVGEGESAEPK
jgi:hypothetical protein